MPENQGFDWAQWGGNRQERAPTFDFGSLFNRNQSPASTPAAGPRGTEDWFRGTYDRMKAKHGDYGGYNNFLKKPGSYAFPFLAESAQASAPQAYAGLFDLLSNQGKVDPGAMNWQLNDIARSTQNAQRQFAGQSAASLNQGSGVAQAVQAAIGQGGLDRRARVQDQFVDDAEKRRRADLMLFMEMVMNPTLNVAGVERGHDAAEGQGGNAWSQIASLLGTGMQGYSTFGGGGAAKKVVD